MQAYNPDRVMWRDTFSQSLGFFNDVLVFLHQIPDRKNGKRFLGMVPDPEVINCQHEVLQILRINVLRPEPRNIPLSLSCVLIA